MILIVGLGNPGEEYQLTRHNVGFLVMDKLAQRFDLSWKLHKKLHTEIAKDTKLILAKPQTFMNLSGIALGAITTIYPVPISNTVIIHDDIDLPFGTIRVSFAASSAGHRGVKSIIDYFSSKDFWRIRVGIRPNLKSAIKNLQSINTPDFVLKKFSKEEQKILPKILTTATEMIQDMLTKKPSVKTIHIQ